MIKEFLQQDLATRDASRINVIPFTSDKSMYAHLLKRFGEEAMLLSKMQHPNVVKVLWYFTENNTAYFVMEYHEGETLQEYLSSHPYPSEKAILSIMIPVMEGTKYVHEQGFLHRDIAPDKIYLVEGDMPLLIDFGSARNAIAQQSKNISSIVKEGYSGPEQYTVNNQQNASADIYALGAVFYRMITGKTPPSAPQRQNLVLNDEPDPIQHFPTEYAGRYTPILLHAVAKAMNLRSHDRFASVAAFEEALTQHIVVDSTPAPRSHSYVPSQAIETPSAPRRRTGVWLFALSFLVVSGIVGYFATHKETFSQIVLAFSASRTLE